MKKTLPTKLLCMLLMLCMTFSVFQATGLAEADITEEETTGAALEDAPPTAALSLAFVEEDPPQTEGRVDTEILWAFTASGAQRITYAMLLDGKVIEEKPLSPAVSPFAYTPEEPGEYILRLTVWDADGAQLMREARPIQVRPVPLAAKLSADAAAYSSGETVTLTGRVSGGIPPYDASIHVYIGDALLVESTEQTLAWTIGETGTYRAVLRVTDAQGNTVEDALDISLGEGEADESTPPPTDESEDSNPPAPDTDAPTEPKEPGADDELDPEIAAAAEQILIGWTTQNDETDPPLTPETEGSTEATAPLVITEVTESAAEATTGSTLYWTIAAEGGEAPYTYRYFVLRNGEIIENATSTADLDTYAHETTVEGEYALLVTLTDAAGVEVSVQSGISAVITPAEETVVVPEYRSMAYPGEGEGVRIKAGVSEAAEGAVRIARFALITELQIAYVTCDQAIFSLGENATWNALAVGGDGDYQYKFTLYRQPFDGKDEVNYWEVTTSQYSASPTYTYNMTQQGRYFVECFVKDSKGDAVSFYSGIVETERTADLGLDPTDTTMTVAKKAAEVVASEIKAGMSDREKAAALHDWLVNNADYDKEKPYHFQADGVLLLGTGVCQSYTLAYVLLCKLAGLECEMVTGTAGGVAHSWNIVKIDGVWLHVDCTWDDPVGGTPNRNYFLITDEQIRKNHQWDSTPVDGQLIDGIYPTVEEIYVSSVSLGNAEVSLALGAEHQLSPTVYPTQATNKTLAYASSDASIVSVNDAGKLTALKIGTATITATAHNQKATSVRVTVTDPNTITALAFSGPTLVLDVRGSKTDLKSYLSFTPATSASAFTWTLSSGASAILLDGAGVVTPQQVGTATVTVSAINGGKTASIQVRVVDTSTTTATGTTTTTTTNRTTTTIRPTIVTASPGTIVTPTAKPTTTQASQGSPGTSPTTKPSINTNASGTAVTLSETEPMEVPAPQVQQLSVGEMHTYNYGRVALHAYAMTNPINEQSILLETSTALIGIESPGFTENMTELTDFIGNTKKPLVGVLLSSHLDGASNFGDTPLITTQAALDNAQTGCAVMGLTDGFKAAYGESYNATLPENATVIEPGNVSIEGVEFITTATSDGFDIEIPLLKAVFTHMMGGDTHSLLTSAAQIDETLARLMSYKDKGYELILSAHHAPEDAAALEAKIAYLEQVKALVASSGSREAFVSAMQSAFPGFLEPGYLDATAAALFP